MEEAKERRPRAEPHVSGLDFDDLLMDMGKRFRALQAKNMDLWKENEVLRAQVGASDLGSTSMAQRVQVAAAEPDVGRGAQPPQPPESAKQGNGRQAWEDNPDPKTLEPVLPSVPGQVGQESGVSIKPSAAKSLKTKTGVSTEAMEKQGNGRQAWENNPDPKALKPVLPSVPGQVGQESGVSIKPSGDESHGSVTIAKGRGKTPPNTRHSQIAQLYAGLKAGWNKTQSLDFGSVARGHASSHRELSKKPLFERIARDQKFEIVCGFAIVVNLVYLGVQTDLMLKAEFQQIRGYEAREPSWVIGDAFFAAVFTAELLIRVMAFRLRLVFGHERWWNMFDTIVVIAADWEVIAELSGISSRSLGTNILRTARVFRIIRLLRVGRSWALVRNVKTVLYALVGSVWAFAAAFSLLVVTLYVFGLVFMVDVEKGLQAAHSPYLQNRLEDLFGSLGLSLWTLFACITGGHDWAEIAAPLIELNSINRFVFALYIVCMYLGIVNILNGTFVHAAMNSANMDRELVVDAAMRDEQSMINEIVTLFLEGDCDQSGTISWEEFQEYMKDEKIKAYLMALDLDLPSLSKIFRILDKDASGDLQLDEYVEGFVSLRGVAKKVDFALLLAEVQDLIAEVRRLHAGAAHP